MGRKKSQDLNINDSGNTGDGGKTVGGAIGAYGSGIGDSLLALYACITFIYGSSWNGEMASEAKRSLVKSSEELGEVFPGEAGEQGDLMSPYLFTLVMEMLSLIVQDKIEEKKEFKYHFGCKKIKLIHVCFADDLLIFCNGDKSSVNVLKEAI
ncbi:RNA-directed DNA polymerase, eukaryota, reverse transcriptase zinc-binding domain protein [Tanacetum coccineum]